MIELSIQTVMIFVGLMILLGLGFLGIIVYILIQRLRNPENADQNVEINDSTTSKQTQKMVDPIQSAVKFSPDDGRWNGDQERIGEDETEGFLPIIQGYEPLATLYCRLEDEKLAVLLPGKASLAKQGELSERENSLLVRTQKELGEWLRQEEKPAENLFPAISTVSLPTFTENKGKSFRKKAEIEEKANMMSMASQVNEVLQDMLASEHYQGPEIRMMDGLHGDLLIYVGSQKYTAIDDIPDKTIGEFIRKAAEYWANVNYKQ